VSFGYFPGYTIGNLVGAQLMEKIRSDISDLDAQIERGEFAGLLTWLRNNVHRHGRKFTPNELLERTTGKPMTAGPWIDYVKKKYGALYGIKATQVSR
jgi:carboxypeptidase Taq